MGLAVFLNTEESDLLIPEEMQKRDNRLSKLELLAENKEYVGILHGGLSSVLLS